MDKFNSSSGIPFTLMIHDSSLLGDGKTHYIKQQLSLSHSSCIIAVNESFTILGAIKKLLQLPSDQTNCSVFFNFTLLPPGRVSLNKQCLVSL